MVMPFSPSCCDMAICGIDTSIGQVQRELTSVTIQVRFAEVNFTTVNQLIFCQNQQAIVY
ncbi:hypothetical protein [Euhalothece natronophila]|uniref:hypothetical protein n=1 Tax=Euhalothece natronophila TaxID=577489 RepID=UPI00164709F7|nr:hypothetical protein [Euhalothece natronophila]